MMTVQLGPMPPVAAGLQSNENSDLRNVPEAGIDRPPLSADAVETDRAVDPPTAAGRSVPVPDRDLPPLIPPDPQAPAGPPPAFEASILDRVRQSAANPAQDPAGPTAPIQKVEAQSVDVEPAAPYDVPPSAEERAEAEVATVRRIETPYDTATVDVSR